MEAGVYNLQDYCLWIETEIKSDTKQGVLLQKRQINTCVCVWVCVRSCAFINDIFQVLTKRNKHYLLKRRKKKHLRNISALTQSKYKEEDIISLV